MGLSAILTLGVPLVAKLVEKLIGNGNGAQKKSTAIDVVKAIIAQFATPGTGLPGEEEIGGIVQAAVDALNKAGALQGQATAIDATTDAELAQIGAAMVSQGISILHRSGALKG